MTDVAALVLAAGKASRYRAVDPSVSSKLVAGYRGKPLVRHAVEAAAASRARPILAVTGYARDAVDAALAGLPVRIVHNRDYASGLATSLQTGIAALPAEICGVVVLLGDMPLVTAAIIDRLIGTFVAAPEAAVVPVIGGRQGNPVLLPRAFFAKVMRLGGDEGARRLLQAPANVRELAIDDIAVAMDVDTPAALTA